MNVSRTTIRSIAVKEIFTFISHILITFLIMIKINSGSKRQNDIHIHIAETFAHLHRLNKQPIPYVTSAFKWLSYIPKFHLPL